MREGDDGRRSGRGIYWGGGGELTGSCLNTVRETPAVPKSRSRAKSKMGRGLMGAHSPGVGGKGVSGEAE